MSNLIIATYGHGTENDFVILFDPDNQREISSHQIAAICNRKTGIGADGFIRILKNTKDIENIKNHVLTRIIMTLSIHFTSEALYGSGFIS